MKTRPLISKTLLCAALLFGVWGCSDDTSSAGDGPATADSRGDQTGGDAARSDLSAVDAPAVDAPAVDAPAVDAPTVDAPAGDSLGVDAPAVDSTVGDDGASDTVGSADAGCIKPGANVGPACVTKTDCEKAPFQPCFLKCLGCGCVCHRSLCYDLRDYLCKP